MVKSTLLFFLASIWNFTFAQAKPKLYFGTLDTTRVSVEEFNAQRNLKIQGGYRIDSAVVYFSGTNFYTVQMVNFLPKFDSVKFLKCKELLMPGSAVVFEVTVKQWSNNASSKETLPFLFYSVKKLKIYN
jgi:hypothetical protein